MKPIASIAALSRAHRSCSPPARPSGSARDGSAARPTPAPSVAQGSPDLTPEPSRRHAGAIVGADRLASTPPSPTAAPTGTTIVRAYFYLGGEPGSAGLVPVLREVPATKAVATAAMNALLAGPTRRTRAARCQLGHPRRHAAARPHDQERRRDGRPVERVRSRAAAARRRSIRLGQVVYTLTQFPTVKSVLFQIEGQTVTVFGSEGIVLDGPVGRADYVDLLPSIFVDRPAYGAAIGNPARVTGSAHVFEATFLVTLLDGDGRTIVDQQAMATCMCESGRVRRDRAHTTSRRRSGARSGSGTRSAKDGSADNVREYPVWLTPAG